MSTYAIVNPANAPPDTTKIIATVKYSHRSGSSGLLGNSSWPLIQLVNGAATAPDIWEAARNRTLARPTTAGRVPAGETLYLELCDRIVIVEAKGTMNSVCRIAGVALFPPTNPIHPNWLSFLHTYVESGRRWWLLQNCCSFKVRIYSGDK